ncbi:MAG: CapA family protein [Oscillospiraceae bacterium]|nr:CapA family protein [Oscillospiraceae bacterium]
MKKGLNENMNKLLSAVLIMMMILTASCSGEAVPVLIDIPDDEITDVGGEPDEQPADEEEQFTVDDEPELPPEYITIRAVAVGDNLIHSSIYNQANIRAGGGDNYDFAPAYERIRHLVEGYDLSMINQETLVNNVYPPSNWPHFSTPGALGDLMIEMGFNAFTIANNHTLDINTSGLTASLDYWNGKIGQGHDIAVVGAYYDAGDRANIRTLDINGVVFSFLGYAESLNGLDSWLIPPVEVGRFSNAEMPVILAEIETAKTISDVCVVFLHWGTEDWDQIEEYQRVAAQAMVDAGADIIHGTHPHVLRDVEFITRESDSTQALVMYSLGNFISSQIVPQTMICGIFAFDIIVNKETRTIEITDLRITPVITHYESGHTNVRLYPLAEYTRELAAVHGIESHPSFSHTYHGGLWNYDYIYEVLKRTVRPEFLNYEF